MNIQFTIPIIVGSFAVLFVGCGKFSGNMQQLSSLEQPSISTNEIGLNADAGADPNTTSNDDSTIDNHQVTVGESAQRAIQKRAIAEILSELQVVQVDGLVDKAGAFLSRSGGAWGDVGGNLNVQTTTGGGGYGSGGGGGGTTIVEPVTGGTDDPDFAINSIRDCPLGGTYTAKSNPSTTLPDSPHRVFASQSTPTIQTNVVNSIVTFNECKVSVNGAEFELRGSLAANSAQSNAVYSAQNSGETIGLQGNGTAGSVAGTLTIIDSQGQSDRCYLNLNARVNRSDGSFLVSHKSGIVGIDAVVTGSFCSQSSRVNLNGEVRF